MIGTPGGGAPTGTVTPDVTAEPPEGRWFFSSCEHPGDLFVIDARGAGPDSTARLLEEVRQCTIDGVLFHPEKSGENACNDIVRCAEAVENSCGKVKSYAEIAMIGNGRCSGTCANGRSVSVDCA